MSVRSWATCYTREGRFSPVGVFFHWLMAILIVVQLALGWLLSAMPAGGGKLAGYALHGTIGVAIFAIAVFRIIWRTMVPDPYNAADRQGWRTTVAYVVEHLFYLTFFILPLSGWAMWSSVASPGSIHFVISWPQLPFYDLETWRQWAILDVAEDFHLIFAWLLMLMIPLHVGAALKHHFWDRDDVLQGMLPQIPDAEMPPEVPRHRPTPRQSPLD
jgi:cytochrome b561